MTEFLAHNSSGNLAAMPLGRGQSSAIFAYNSSGNLAAVPLGRGQSSAILTYNSSGNLAAKPLGRGQSSAINIYSCDAFEMQAFPASQNICCFRPRCLTDVYRQY